MSNLIKRIEKVENAMHLTEKEQNDIKAKLLEIQRLEKQDPIKALALRMELEKKSLATMISDALREKNRLQNETE